MKQKAFFTIFIGFLLKQIKQFDLGIESTTLSRIFLVLWSRFQNSI